MLKFNYSNSIRITSGISK